MFSPIYYSVKARLELKMLIIIQKFSGCGSQALISPMINLRVKMLWITLILSISIANAQEIRFNKIYDLGGPSAIYNSIFNVIPTTESQYFFTGTNYDVTYPYNTNFFYGLMDDTGKILELRKIYMDTVSLYYNEYSCHFGNKYYTTFNAFNSEENKFDVYVYCIAENMDTIWTKKLGIPMNSIGPKKILINPRNNIVIAGGCNFGDGARGFFIELDTLGDIQNLDTTIVNLSQAELFDIIPSKLSEGYICAGIAYLGDVGQNFVCGLDSLGHRTWYRNMGGAGEDGSLGIEYINDTTFLVCGFRRLSVGGGAIANLIVITETNQLKRDYFPSTPEVRLQDIEKIFKKGNYYYGFGYTQDIADSVVIFCMDTSFNFIWARYYLRDRSPNILYDFRATSDGGFIACGSLVGPLNQDGWVLKLDSLGCDVSNCWIKDTTIDTATIIIPAYSSLQNIKIYPNPIRDKFQVEFEAMDLGENYSIDIKNILSEIIFTRMLDENKSEIDIHSLDAALYFYEIKNKDGMRVACGKLLKE